MNVDNDTIAITMPGKDHAFMHTIGNATAVCRSDLETKMDQESVLDDWSHVLMHAGIGNPGGDVDTKIMEEFSIKSTNHSTQGKFMKIKNKHHSCEEESYDRLT